MPSQQSSTTQPPYASSSTSSLLSSPPLCYLFASGEQALAFAKHYASQHGYDLVIVQSRGRGTTKTWSLRCASRLPDEGGNRSIGKLKSLCPFSITVRPTVSGSSTMWRLYLRQSAHRCQVQQPAITSAVYLSCKEKEYLTSQIDTTKPCQLIQHIKEQRARLGLVQLLRPRLVYDYLSDLRRKSATPSHPDLKSVSDLYVTYPGHRDYGRVGNGVFFTHRDIVRHLACPRAQEVLFLQFTAKLQKETLLLVQFLVKSPATGSPRTLAFALVPVQDEDQSIWEWLLCQLEPPRIVVVAANAQSALRSAVTAIWPSSRVLAQGGSEGDDVRHYGVMSPMFLSSPPLKTIKRPLIHLVEDVIAWQHKGWGVEACEMQKQRQIGAGKGSSDVVKRLWGTVAHPAIRIIENEFTQAKGRLAGARNLGLLDLALARTAKMECTHGLTSATTVPPLSLGKFDTKACSSWSTMGLPCAHRLALLITAGQELQPCDIASFWHLDAENNSADLEGGRRE